MTREPPPLPQLRDPMSGRADVGDSHSSSLIAAAPDLLAALIMVRDADDDCGSDGFSRIPPVARSVIDRAIAKAEGRT